MRPVLRRLWAVRRAICLYGLLLLFGLSAGHLLRDFAFPEMRPMNEPLIHRIVMGALLVFVLAAAVPFVPGAEIGFALLLVFGGQAAPVVYVGMVGALLLSYCAARFVPFHVLAALAGWLGLKRMLGLLDEIALTPPPDRARLLENRLHGRFSRGLLHNRYLVLVLLLNLPGNSVLGGGGGLAFLAGISGLYRFVPYLVSVLVAVAPIPLLFLWLDR